MFKILRRVKILIHLQKNKLYWKQYYKTHRETIKHTSFAEFCNNNYLNLNPNSNLNLLELGCGNGRDAIYFANNNINVTAIDLCAEELKFLKNKNKNKNLKFLSRDFTSYKNYLSYDYVYSRFTIHSISDEQELNTIKNTYLNLRENGLFFIEVRSNKDELLKNSVKITENEGVTDHYRRFISYEKLQRNLLKQGFEIIYKIEEKNLAVYGNENPYIIRIIAKKIRARKYSG